MTSTRIAISRGLRKFGRTLIQFIGGGGLTLLVNQLVADLSETGKLAVGTAMTLLIVFIQNVLEGTGTIPTILPSPRHGDSSVPPVITPAPGGQT